LKLKEGVLHECLQHPDVEKVLVINRKPCGVSHPKLIEILHNNFLDLSSLEPQLAPYNACFFLLGCLIDWAEGSGVHAADLRTDIAYGHHAI
jgi:hypothetical protein